MNEALHDWQKTNGISNRHLAETVKVHESYITHIRKGRRIPSPALALRIEQATNGAVSRMELLYPQKEAAK